MVWGMHFRWRRIGAWGLAGLASFSAEPAAAQAYTLQSASAVAWDGFGPEFVPDWQGVVNVVAAASPDGPTTTVTSDGFVSQVDLDAVLLNWGNAWPTTLTPIGSPFYEDVPAVRLSSAQARTLTVTQARGLASDPWTVARDEIETTASPTRESNRYYWDPTLSEQPVPPFSQGEFDGVLLNWGDPGGPLPTSSAETGTYYILTLDGDEQRERFAAAVYDDGQEAGQGAAVVRQVSDANDNTYTASGRVGSSTRALVGLGEGTSESFVHTVATYDIREAQSYTLDLAFARSGEIDLALQIVDEVTGLVVMGVRPEPGNDGRAWSLSLEGDLEPGNYRVETFAFSDASALADGTFDLEGIAEFAVALEFSPLAVDGTRLAFSSSSGLPDGLAITSGHEAWVPPRSSLVPEPATWCTCLLLGTVGSTRRRPR